MDVNEVIFLAWFCAGCCGWCLWPHDYPPPAELVTSSHQRTRGATRQNKLQSFRRERDELVALLRELIDIEGPQPGHVMWARKVQDALAKIAP